MKGKSLVRNDYYYYNIVNIVIFSETIIKQSLYLKSADLFL